MGGLHIQLGVGGRDGASVLMGGFKKNHGMGGGPPPTKGNPRLGGLRDTKFGTNLSNKKLLNAAKFQGYSFYRF